MVRHVWSGFPEHEIPVGHVTNGIHIPSFISREMHELFSRYLGPEWLAEPSEAGHMAAH
jgi:starch phosphorylase